MNKSGRVLLSPDEPGSNSPTAEVYKASLVWARPECRASIQVRVTLTPPSAALPRVGIEFR